MYRRILIANRSDCAVELVHVCHDLHIETIVIAARDDELESVRSIADFISYTGQSRDAYSDQDNIIETAKHYGCEAILPGWGFLSEDFQFARRCRMTHIDYIGPTSSQLQIFGDKLKTLQYLSPALGISSHAICCGDPDFSQKATMIQNGWMLKNRFGGGGKGITYIQDYHELCQKVTALKSIHKEKQYYIEPAIPDSERHHLEFQVMGDGCGRVELLGARDCTPQKNHQKWLERSIDLDKRPDIRSLGLRFCTLLAEMRYLSWGTVECMVDSHGYVHLLELNPRLQVEHLVTDISSHVSIIHDAILQSCHHTFPKHNSIEKSLSAMEFRLYARSAGKLKSFHIPKYDEAISHVETGYQAGDEVSGTYDGMLARFVVGTTDGSELHHLKRWLSSCRIEGVEHNLNDLHEMDNILEMPEILI